MKTFKEIRKSFWDNHPEFKSEYRKTWSQNQYRTDIRCAYVDYLDYLVNNGMITQELSENATL